MPLTNARIGVCVLIIKMHITVLRQALSRIGTLNTATALKAEVWIETATEGGRRFMAAWRKEEVDAARYRQEKREATRLRNLLSHTEA